MQPSPVLMNCSGHRRNQHHGGLNRTSQTDSPGISVNTEGTELLLVAKARNILQDRENFVLHIRSKVKVGTFVNSALLLFTIGLVLRNTIQ
jgi:hypothetical protein